MNLLVIEKIGFDTNILVDSLRNINNNENININLSNTITNSLKLLLTEVFDVIILNPVILQNDIENNIKIFLNYGIPIILLVDNNYSHDKLKILEKFEINRIFIKGNFQIKDLYTAINNVIVETYDSKKFIEKITMFREKQNKAFIILNNLSNNLNKIFNQTSKEYI